MSRKLTLFLGLVCLSFAVKAQDFHWSLFHLNPVYLNPANAGFAKKANRLTGLYRDQWRAVPVPYSTTNIAYDRKIFHNESTGWRLGLGAQLLYDKAGDGALTTFRPALTAAIGKYINNNKQLFQLGIQGAYVRKQIDFSKLSFDSQFDGVGYNPDLSSGEQVAGDNAGYLDLGAGFNFYSDLKDAGGIHIGISAFNLTSPSYTFLSGSEASVAPRITTYAKANIDLGQSDWTFNPGVYYQHQAKAQETLLQAIFGVRLGKAVEGVKNTELQFGPGYRIGDAVVGYVGLNWKDLKIGFAFDGNVSDLKTATGGRGAYEVALNYEWERKKKKDPEEFETVPEVKKEEEQEEEKQDTVSAEKPELEEEIIREDIDGPYIPAPDHTIDPGHRLTEIGDSLKLRAAVRLFFDNDQPNPRTTLATTDVSYDQAYNAYVDALAKSTSADRKAFLPKVEAGKAQLESLLGNVAELLQGGKTVTVEVSGFASPLATSRYNEQLSGRRTASLINYLQSWNNGALKGYIASGRLVIVTKAYGAAQAPDEVSDDPKDKQNSIYSNAAAAERRVELKVTEVK